MAQLIESLLRYAESDEEIEEPSTPSDPWVATLISHRYQVLSLIGSGTTSSVYKALDQETQRLVALKILHRDLISDAYIVRQFEQEAQGLPTNV